MATAVGFLVLAYFVLHLYRYYDFVIQVIFSIFLNKNRNPIADNTRVVMEEDLQGNDYIESNTSNNLGAVDGNFLNNNTKQLSNLENMTVPDSDSQDNLALSHRIKRVNQSSDKFTDSLGIEIGKTANENQDGVENVNFSDDSYADPDYAPSGQSSDSEVEQALIKNTKSGPDNSVTENNLDTTQPICGTQIGLAQSSTATGWNVPRGVKSVRDKRPHQYRCIFP
ncbi:hypothetical protein FQA39_LY08269 [Lamprigera yunnana]|nr:hypothetical protein FQA39_LY08269 [Lamprigera yunnana]